MFLNKLLQTNKKLIYTALKLHQNGQIRPDSYVVDVDQFLDNAKRILETAKEENIRLYFMLKQMGRNPYLAKELVKMGYVGAVAVDYKEAEVMMKHGIPLGNVGHLVQIPEAEIEKIVSYGTEVITVYSLEKIRSIDKTAKKYGKIQGILLRVYDEGDTIYSGQNAGFMLNELPDIILAVKEFSNIKIAGVTSFPCYLYNEEEKKFESTPNLTTVKKALDILKSHGIVAEIVNTPSATCIQTLKVMGKDGSNCAEPGHSLSGTTPANMDYDNDEKISVVYVSEVSHNFKGHAYCYGGGYYRRSNVENALCGSLDGGLKQVKVIPPNLDSIDYYFVLSEELPIGDTVIMAFRFQIFVTRSDVVLVKGISRGEPEIIGVYDSLGNEIK